MEVVGKKFKIKTPEDSYELDVGIPPLVVVKLEELSTSIIYTMHRNPLVWISFSKFWSWWYTVGSIFKFTPGLCRSDHFDLKFI
jgi:hypothetical protein